MSEKLDLRSPKQIHIVGLGGTGMSAIAEILIGTGHRVSGSDLSDSVPLARLKETGVATFIGHDRSQVPDVDVVAISAAIPANNPEVVEAKQRGIPIFRRAELLASITKTWRTIAVAGTHGKTTTSAMLTSALIGAGADPAFIVGGDLSDLGKGAAVGGGEFLVVEADESDGTFIELEADGVIVTNLEPDHLEYYGNFAGLEAAFKTFITQASGPKVVCIDDSGAAKLAADLADHELVTYGTKPGADWLISDIAPAAGGIAFTVAGPTGSVDISLKQPGLHNARNATASLVMVAGLGADIEKAAQALSDFGGVGRRFERRGEAGGVAFVDDYAHLPTEVEAALSAGRTLEPHRLVAVFQPHRYSRTEQLWSTFTNAFGSADVVFVTGIYTAGEAPRPGITGRLIADDVKAAHPEADVRYVESLSSVEDHLLKELRAGDLCMTLGAGDLTALPDKLLGRLEVSDAVV